MLPPTKTRSKRVFPLFVLLGVFGFFGFAHADSLIYDTGVLPNGNNASDLGGFIPSTSSQSFDRFDIHVHPGTATGTWTANLGYASASVTSTADTSIVWLATVTGQIGNIPSSTFTSWPAQPWFTIQTSTAVSVPIGYRAAFRFRVDNASAVSVNDNITSSDAPQFCNPGCASGTRIAVRLWGASVPLGQISISYPVSSSGTIPDFGAWLADLENLSTITRYSVSIGYSRSSSVSTYVFDTQTYDASVFGVTSTFLSMPKTTSLQSMSTSTPTTWYATAYLSRYPSAGFGPPEVISQSAQISFSVSNNATTSYFVPPVFATSGSLYGATGTYPLAVNCPDSWLSGNICGAFVALVIPASSSYYGFFDSMNAVGQKIPFAYVGMLTTVLGESYVFTDVNPTVVHIPFPGSSAIDLSLFSSSSVYMLVDPGTVSNLRTLITYFMFFAVLWFGIAKGRTIAKHLSN